MIDRAEIKRKKEYRGDLSSDSDSQHDYRFIIGDSSKPPEI